MQNLQITKHLQAQYFLQLTSLSYILAQMIRVVTSYYFVVFY
jgi:hypothetical protein